MLGLQVVHHAHPTHILEATVNTTQVAHGQQGTEVSSLTPTTSNVNMALSPFGGEGEQEGWVGFSGAEVQEKGHAALSAPGPATGRRLCFKKQDKHEYAAMRGQGQPRLAMALMQATALVELANQLLQ